MCKTSLKANSNFFSLVHQKKVARVKESINSPGIEEAPKDVKAITENTNGFFASVFSIAFLYR